MEQGTWVTVQVADGSEMRMFVARPEGSGPHRAIMVMQEAFGVNSHIRDVTTRFAREGFVAVAPELFHRTGVGVEGRYDDFPGISPQRRQHCCSPGLARWRMRRGPRTRAPCGC